MGLGLANPNPNADLGLDVARAARHGGLGLVRGEHEDVRGHGLGGGDANFVTHLDAVAGGGGGRWSEVAGGGGGRWRWEVAVEGGGGWWREEGASDADTSHTLMSFHTESLSDASPLHCVGELFASLSALWRARSSTSLRAALAHTMSVRMGASVGNPLVLLTAGMHWRTVMKRK